MRNDWNHSKRLRYQDIVVHVTDELWEQELKPKVGEQQSLPVTVQLLGHMVYAHSMMSTTNNNFTNA